MKTKFKIFKVVLIATALVLVGIAIVNINASRSFSEAFKDLDRVPVSAPAVELRSEPLSEEQVRHLKELWEQAVEDYEKAVSDAQTRLHRDLMHACLRYEIRAKAIMQKQVDEHVTRTGLVNLIGLSAQDVVMRDKINREQNWIHQNLVLPLHPATNHFYSQIEQSTAKFAHELNAFHADFEARVYDDVAKIVQDPTWQPNVGSLMAMEIQEKVGGVGNHLQVALPVVMLPAEIIGLRPEPRRKMNEAIHKVIKSTYQKALKTRLRPLVTRAVVAISAAAGDGPLPFGDAFAVGMAGWAAYDIATMASSCRNDMMSGFTSGLKEIRQDVELTVLNPLDRQIKGQFKSLRDSSEVVIDIFE